MFIVNQVQGAAVFPAETHGVLIGDEAVMPAVDDFDSVTGAAYLVGRVVVHVNGWRQKEKAFYGYDGAGVEGDPSAHAGADQVGGRALFMRGGQHVYSLDGVNDAGVVEALNVIAHFPDDSGKAGDFAAPGAAFFSMYEVNKRFHRLFLSGMGFFDGGVICHYTGLWAP